MNQMWAQKAVRLAIALGHDANIDVLQDFIGPDPQAGGQVGRSMQGVSTSARQPLQASNATALAQYIEWASTAVVGAASMPVSRTQGSASEGNIPLPDLPPTLIDPIDGVGPVVW